MASHKPVIGVSACRKHIAPHAYHAAQEKYVSAVSVASGGLPLLVPALGGGLDLDALVDVLDGLFLTGSPSNVEPAHYGTRLAREDTLLDPHRDSTTLPLIRRAVDAGLPLLAVCRGFQELNVAFGGTLHQHVQEVTGMHDHREDKSLTLEEQYAPAHEVTLVEGGRLAAITGRTHIAVNSLHSQGVDRPGEGLAVEATAPDGLIEAFRVGSARAFALGVQWHPEWRVMDDPASRALFTAFGDACRERARRRDPDDRNLHDNPVELV